MQLIGMLDSPYVRRVAISLLALGLPFEHRRLSVFRDLEAFRAINPAVKAPTLVCDDGTVLMDSTLIVDYAQALAAPRTLLSPLPAERARELALVGLALAACEKGAQLVYERALRPPEKRHAPWVRRVGSQLAGACAALESALAARPLRVDGASAQSVITTAVAWRYLQGALAEQVRAEAHPAWAALSAAAEALPWFRAAPADEAAVCAAGTIAGSESEVRQR